jgi:hypothetical protein
LHLLGIETISKLARMISAVLKRMFSDDMIFTAAPFESGCKWLMLWGNENTYQLKEFSTYGEAESKYLAIKNSEHLGIGYTNLKVHDIEVQRAKCIVDLESYLNTIQSILRNS